MLMCDSQFMTLRIQAQRGGIFQNSIKEDMKQ
jgi:hypothetical protein